MRDPENIRAVEATGVNWMGFILWPGSSRYVAEVPAYLPAPPVKRVGVFVRPTVAEVIEAVHAFGLDLVQLHGGESAAFCSAVKAATTSEQRPAGIALIKAFSIASAADLDATTAFEDVADYFLFDTKTPLVGGSGRQFDWSILDAYDGAVPFLLSGGIGPEDAARLREYHHHRCIGIDLNSRFETAPAMKDAAVLAHFIKELKRPTPQASPERTLSSFFLAPC